MSDKTKAATTRELTVTRSVLIEELSGGIYRIESDGVEAFAATKLTLAKHLAEALDIGEMSAQPPAPKKRTRGPNKVKPVLAVDIGAKVNTLREAGE